jgi:hypothetical protein
MITFHHFGMLSTNPEASRQMLEALGYQMQGPIEDPQQNVRAYLGTHPSNPTVEIISPTDTPGPVTTLARRIHQGVYHRKISFYVVENFGLVELLERA